MNVKLSFVVGKEAMRLVTSVVLGAESPVHVWEHGLFLKVNCAEYTAAYFDSPQLTLTVEKNEVYQLLAHF